MEVKIKKKECLYSYTIMQTRPAALLEILILFNGTPA